MSTKAQKQSLTAAEWVGIDSWLRDIILSDNSQEYQLLDVHWHEDLSWDSDLFGSILFAEDVKEVHRLTTTSKHFWLNDIFVFQNKRF